MQMCRDNDESKSRKDGQEWMFDGIKEHQNLMLKILFEQWAINMDEQIRQRRLRRLLRVTLPDGKVLCYKSATMTFVEALQMIQVEWSEIGKLSSAAYLPRDISTIQRMDEAHKGWMVCQRAKW